MKVVWTSRVAIAVLCVAVGGLAAGSASAIELPDGRFYEQVTPEEKLGSEAYQPTEPWFGLHEEFEVKQAKEATSQTETRLTFQAAADGSGIAYVAAPTVEGNENSGAGGGNEYLATRLPSGEWRQRVLSPENAPDAVFQAFSPDLATAFVDSPTPLSPLAPGFGETSDYLGNYDVLYSTSTAGSLFTPLFSIKPPNRAMGYFGTAGPHEEPGISLNAHRGGKRFLALEGMSADDAHLLFAANDALTETSEGRPAAEGGKEEEFEEEDNLYEWFHGGLRLVNVLPDGSTHANATFGGVEVSGVAPLTTKRAVLSRVISADGSRIFWTDLSTGHIYMREDGATTVEIAPEGTYQAATADGSVVFYTNGSLYAYEVADGHTTDLTPGVTVERVLGSSENGEYIYYLTEGKKLALWHDGVSTQITSTSIRIDGLAITAEVTPDGHQIVFTSEEEKIYPEQHNAAPRVEVYDATTNTLYCVSCTAHGTIGYLQMSNAENVYQPRWVTPNGDRVFYVSPQGLVPQDTNETLDVYEWVHPGVDGCTESTGCVNLLSGGTSTANSLFLDASEGGDDVFIVSRANFVGSDEDGLYDVYDVRFGQPPATPPACSGTGCQGLPSPTPIFATPSSVTFEGVGNFATSTNGKQVKPKSGAKPKAAKQRKNRKKKHKKKGSKKSKSVRAARAGVKGGRS